MERRDSKIKGLSFPLRRNVLFGEKSPVKRTPHQSLQKTKAMYPLGSIRLEFKNKVIEQVTEAGSQLGTMISCFTSQGTK